MQRQLTTPRRLARCFILPFLLAVGFLPVPGLAQDLSLQVNFFASELQRGEPFQVGFVVSNETNSAASSYQVELFGSSDDSLGNDDTLLGTFESTGVIPQQSFRENTLSLNTCPLSAGSWRIIGRIKDVVPGDSDPLNDIATAPSLLTLTAGPGLCDEQSGVMNAGLNDAWFDPAKPGQGLLVSVFPETRLVFAAWFTFDTQRPQQPDGATFGAAGHRWLTAIGGWEGSTALLDITNTRGGLLDRAEPIPVNETGYGTVTIEFHSCSDATLAYELNVDDPDNDAQGESALSGTFPLQRVVNDNVLLCEQLSAITEAVD